MPGPGFANVIVDPHEVADWHNLPNLRLFDCRFRLDDPSRGYQLWLDGHLPGAWYANLERDLSGPKHPGNGRHPLPDADHFIAWCQNHGIDEHACVVCYDDVGGAFAARLWWLLNQWLGHASTHVLNGGLQRWQREGRAVSTEIPALPAPTTWSPSVNTNAIADATELAGRAASSPLVMDARARERFRGDVEPIDPVAGHVPGAINHPFSENLDDDGNWLSPDALAAQFRTVQAIEQGAPVVHMCGSGVTACHNVLAMARAGLGAPRLYAGSWSEWITQPQRPVATGED